MQTLIIYASIHHQNTEKVARAIADTLSADMVKVGQMEKEMLNKYDRIGFGSGIYFGKFHRTMFDFIKDLPIYDKKSAFTFATSGEGKTRFNKSFESKLIQKGFVIKGSFGCKGFDTFGPLKLIGGLAKGKPDTKDLENAKEFATKLEQ